MHDKPIKGERKRVNEAEGVTKPHGVYNVYIVSWKNGLVYINTIDIK